MVPRCRSGIEPQGYSIKEATSLAGHMTRTRVDARLGFTNKRALIPMKTLSTFCAVLALGALSNSGMAGDKPKAEIPAAGADGWIPLFNGKDLTGWEGLKGYWTVVDGAIQCSETK
jgi:hypothetical protein